MEWFMSAVGQGVQCRMVFVDIFFRFLKIIIDCFVVDICDLNSKWIYSANDI